MGAGGGRWLAGVSSEWEDEQQLLVSEVDSFIVQADRDDTSSRKGGREGGGGGTGGRRGGGGGIGDGGGSSGRHGWKPLHFGLPFVIGAEGSYSFRVSTLSRDFVLQRFFYKKHKQEERQMIKIYQEKVKLHARFNHFSATDTEVTPIDHRELEALIGNDGI